MKHDANLDEGLRELEAAITRHKPAHAEFYFELAEAYRRSGKLAQAIPFYEQSAARTPGDWRYPYRLGTALVAAGQAARAGLALERARSLAPREPAVLEAIANLLASQGKLLDAVATLQDGTCSGTRSRKSTERSRSTTAATQRLKGRRSRPGAKRYACGPKLERCD